MNKNDFVKAIMNLFKSNDVYYYGRGGIELIEKKNKKEWKKLNTMAAFMASLLEDIQFRNDPYIVKKLISDPSTSIIIKIDVLEQRSNMSADECLGTLADYRNYIVETKDGSLYRVFGMNYFKPQTGEISFWVTGMGKALQHFAKKKVCRRYKKCQ